jgi:hypothetical protein|tara:strand:- start:379 stop:1002 length:624 start_codon:yes stop_codon:yes gene_type:complete
MPATDIRTSLNNFIDEYLIFVPDSSSLTSGLGGMVKEDVKASQAIDLLQITIANLMLLGKQVNALYPLVSSDPEYDYTAINLVLNNIIDNISDSKSTLSNNVENCKPKIRIGSVANKYASGKLNDALSAGSNNSQLESLFQVKDTIQNALSTDYSLALIGTSGVTLIETILTTARDLDIIIESKVSLTNTEDDSSTSTLEMLIQGLS